jgi:membrane associated rhomboid family serine protease
MFPLYDNIPRQRFPWMNCLIILACALAFYYQTSLPKLGVALAFRPAMVLTVKGLSHGPLPILQAALVTMFMHASLFHLLSNMWFLWIFGDNVEDRMGHFPYLLFYLICGVVATGAHTLMAGLGLAGSLTVPMIGASGAIAGVMGAYYRLFPGARIKTLIFLLFIFFIDVPAVLFILLWFVMQVYSGLHSLGVGTGVAVWAHVGGFLAGAILVGLFARRPQQPKQPRIVQMRWE